MDSLSETQAVARAPIAPHAVLLLLGLCALWGLQQVSVKLAVAGGLPPAQLAAARSAIAAVCLGVWVAGTGGFGALRRMLPPGSLLPGCVVALVFGIEFAAMYAGLRLTSASRGVLFIYTTPFFTALAAHLWLGERLGWRAWLGLAVAFAGVGVVFANAAGASSQGSGLGDALCLASAVLWAVNTIVIKASRGLRRGGARSVLLYQLAGSVPVLLAASWLLGEPAVWPRATAVAWGCLLYQAIIVAFASYLAWFWLVLRYPAGRLSGFTFFTPLCGIAAGALVLGEPVGWALLAGGASVALGLRLLNMRG